MHLDEFIKLLNNTQQCAFRRIHQKLLFLEIRGIHQKLLFLEIRGIHQNYYFYAIVVRLDF